METEFLELLTTTGPLIVIALVFFKNTQEDREDRRSKDDTLANNNRALEDLSKAVTALMTTIDRSNVIQETMCRDLTEIKTGMDDIKKLSEKTYTSTVINGKQNEAIIREAFDKRVSEGIEEEVRVERRKLEEDLANTEEGFYTKDKEEEV